MGGLAQIDGTETTSGSGRLFKAYQYSLAHTTSEDGPWSTAQVLFEFSNAGVFH
jgi:hypothetical protein